MQIWQSRVAVALTLSDMVERWEVGVDGGRVRGSMHTRAKRGEGQGSVFKTLKKKRRFGQNDLVSRAHGNDQEAHLTVAL